MPEAVKISQLPPLSSVRPNDILPIVDEFITQTARCTASQIAEIGGGPPGVNTVSTDKIQNGAVTAVKVGFTGPDKLVSRIDTGAGNGVEIPCSPYARGLLAAATGQEARAYLDALQSSDNPTFTGQVRFADGTAGAPSITNFDNLNTGVFFPLQNSVGISTLGFERLRVSEDGSQYSNIPGEVGSDELRSQYPIRAWLNFAGTETGVYRISNQHIIHQRYRNGVWGSFADDPDTKAKLQALELSTTGWNVTFPTGYTVGTEGRSNYTTCSDNVHSKWSVALNAWTTVPACSSNWIGKIDITPPPDGRAIKGYGNIAAVTRVTTGAYRINFSRPMPDLNYAVVGSVNSSTVAQAVVFRVGAVTTGYFEVTTAHKIAAQSEFVPVDVPSVFVMVIR